ncbi:sporulation-control protein [Paenibacillus chitinolyticus]|uniref:sporulation protein n=1 Tax=Paenibacillus chitinolyticus TaxID=79263 RepID=UPI0026E4A8A2|nr:sporulation protein [Paenibacillus chitinolyticus]GKS10308.1 sporulation-control protein [Paenibacillus chitinolyticus]
MTFFQRMLASIGFGAAQVDTRLSKNTYYPGEEVEGVVHIRGGQVEQRIEEIYISLVTEYKREVNNSRVKETREIAKYLVSEPFTLGPNEEMEVPFRFRLAEHTPLTLGHTPVWFSTGLDIASAIDPSDSDRIEVIPSPEMQVVFDAVDRLGFRLREAEVKQSPRFGGRTGLLQEFEFVPAGRFRGELDELEISFLPATEGLELLMQIDRKARGLAGFIAEAVDADETLLRLRIHPADLGKGSSYMAGLLAELIQDHL